MTPAPLPIKVVAAVIGLGIPLFWFGAMRDIFDRYAVIRWDLFDLGCALVLTGLCLGAFFLCAAVVLS